MKKIIKIKEGQPIPENAIFRHVCPEKEFSHYEYGHGIFTTTLYKVSKLVNYFYYEIDDLKIPEKSEK